MSPQTVKIYKIGILQYPGEKEEVLLAIWGNSDAKKLQTEAQQLLPLKNGIRKKDDCRF